METKIQNTFAEFPNRKWSSSSLHNLLTASQSFIKPVLWIGNQQW